MPRKPTRVCSNPWVAGLCNDEDEPRGPIQYGRRELRMAFDNDIGKDSVVLQVVHGVARIRITSYWEVPRTTPQLLVLSANQGQINCQKR